MRILIPNSERGFILVNAMWLLLLSGAIAAFLTLQGMERGAAASLEGERLKTRLVLESAVEVVIADILFNGPRSRWAVMPTKGVVNIDPDRPVIVELSSESGRLDLNEIDLDTFDTALRGFGADATVRRRIVDDLASGRDVKQPLASWSEAARLLSPLQGIGIGASCVDREFTLYSGSSEPRSTQISPQLARAMGVANQAQSGPIAPGQAIRIEASVSQGMTLTSVLRIIGSQSRVYVALRWEYGDPCL